METKNRKWPDAFIAKVKAEYPDDEQLHEWLDTDKNSVLNFIDGKADNNNNFKIDLEEIIAAFNCPNLEKFTELKKKAEKLVYRRSLFLEGLQLYKEWSQNNPAEIFH